MNHQELQAVPFSNLTPESAAEILAAREVAGVSLRAHRKEAFDIRGVLESLKQQGQGFGQSLLQHGKDLGNSLMDPGSTSNPGAWTTGRNALIGAGIGGLGGAMMPGDNRKRRTATGALLGGLLGGSTGLLQTGGKDWLQPTPADARQDIADIDKAIKTSPEIDLPAETAKRDNLLQYVGDGEPVAPEAPGRPGRPGRVMHSLLSGEPGSALENFGQHPQAIGTGAALGAAAGYGSKQLEHRLSIPMRLRHELDLNTLTNRVGDDAAGMARNIKTYPGKFSRPMLNPDAHVIPARNGMPGVPLGTAKSLLPKTPLSLGKGRAVGGGIIGALLGELAGTAADRFRGQ